MTGSAEAIASYETPVGAAAATARLVELGYDEHEVAIEPHGYQPVEEPTLASCVRSISLRATIGGAAVLMAVETGRRLGLEGIRSAVGVAVVGAAIGLVIGVIVALVQHRSSRVHPIGGTPETLRPHRFDVIVARGPSGANHSLAVWWDPAAAPVRSRRAG